MELRVAEIDDNVLRGKERLEGIATFSGHLQRWRQRVSSQEERSQCFLIWNHITEVQSATYTHGDLLILPFLPHFARNVNRSEVRVSIRCVC